MAKSCQNLDDKIRNDILYQYHTKLHDCMKICMRFMASVCFVYDHVQDFLNLPNY